MRKYWHPSSVQALNNTLEKILMEIDQEKNNKSYKLGNSALEHTCRDMQQLLKPYLSPIPPEKQPKPVDLQSERERQASKPKAKK